MPFPIIPTTAIGTSDCFLTFFNALYASGERVKPARNNLMPPKATGEYRAPPSGVSKTRFISIKELPQISASPARERRFFRSLDIRLANKDYYLHVLELKLLNCDFAKRNF